MQYVFAHKIHWALLGKWVVVDHHHLLEGLAPVSQIQAVQRKNHDLHLVRMGKQLSTVNLKHQHHLDTVKVVFQIHPIEHAPAWTLEAPQKGIIQDPGACTLAKSSIL